MRVFFITDKPFPHGGASTNRLICYAKAIRSQNVECKLLVYVRTESLEKTFGNMEGVGTYEGIPFEYINHSTLHANNIIKQKFEGFIDRISLLKYLKKNVCSGDVVFYYALDELIWIPLVAAVVHGKKGKIVKEVCELPFIFGTYSKVSRFYRKLMTKYHFPKFDGIISISEELLKFSKHYAGRKTKHIKVPILVDYNKYSLPDRSNEADNFYIFHAGSLTEQKDGILGMIEAFGKASERLNHQLFFISTGRADNSPHKLRIKELIEENNISNEVRFVGYLNEEELQDYLSKASLVIINKYETEQNQYCFSTKLAEYFAASKPVIITRVGEAMNWVTDKLNVWLVEPGDVNQLSSAIVLLYNNVCLRKEMGKEGNILCQNCFRYEVYGKVLVDFFISFYNN